MHSLTDWKRFCTALKAGKKPGEFGFTCSMGDINRFASRYRVAKSFRGIQLEGFSPKTQEGYGALFKLFLAYSTFEQFMHVQSFQLTEMQRLFEDHDVNTLCQQIKQLDRNRAFYTFIHSQLDRRAAQDEIEKLWAGKDLNGAYLASTVRHIFAHGQLTPHANQSQPKAVNRICNAIADFLLKIIDTEFSKRLDQAD